MDSKYNFKARDNYGKLVSGSMVADSKDAVAGKLKELGSMPVAINAVSQQGAVSKFFERFQKVSLTELSMFTRQFATLQRAGVSIVLSLKALTDQVPNKILKEALEQVRKDVEEGQSLSESMEKFPSIFGTLYTNTVKTGEESGNLDHVLERLASLSEHEAKIVTQIKAATRYPVIVVTAMILAFLFLILLIMPRFSKLYTQAGVTLPLPTQILIGTNYAVTKYWWIVVSVLAAAIVAFNRFVNTTKGRFLWDGFMLKLPVFGDLFLKMYMSRFARITGTLMHSGVAMLRVLEYSSKGVGNAVVANAIEDIRTGVKEGKGVAEPMRHSGLFPPVVVQMVSVGEDTGKVDELLLFVSDYYDDQVEYTINNLTSLVEPMLLFVLGGGVLLMALGIFLPMWNMMALFKK